MAQFGELLEEIAGRVAEAVGIENTRAKTLAGLFPDAPGSLIELQLRIPDPQPQLVLGFTAPACGDSMVEAATAFAGEEARAAATTWRSCVEPRALDWGVKVPLAGAGCQLYGRWQVEVEDIVNIVGELGGEISGDAPAVREVLTHAKRSFVQMYGVELRGAEPPRHVTYVSTPSLLGAAANLRQRIGRIVTSRLAMSPWRDRWQPVGDVLIRDVEEQVYLSFEPDRTDGWLKIDVGGRSLDQLPALLADMGVGDDARTTIGILERLGAHALSHLGVRLRRDGTPEVTCYAHVFP